MSNSSSPAGNPSGTAIAATGLYDPARRARRLRRRPGRRDRRQAAARDRGRGGDRRAESGLAPRRRRRRRQDRRRRRHPRRRSRRISSTTHVRAHGPRRCSRRQARRRPDLPAAHRPRRAGALPRHRRDARSCASATTIYGWRQVPVEHRRHRREGQRHAARDRADHVRRPARPRRRGRSSATSTSSAAASRSAALAEQHHRPLHLLAVVRAR